MKRICIDERPDWQQKAKEYGFNFHTICGAPYWCENSYYQFTLTQIEIIEEATANLHQMCLQAVNEVLSSDKWMTKFRIPNHTWSFVRHSWQTRQPSLYSRLDLIYNGLHPPKMLENNADTPTSLYEAAFFQWVWLEDQINAGKLPANSDQYNCIQDKLIARFTELKSKYGFNMLHLACCQNTEEDRGTVQYLQDCATEAKLPNTFLYINELGLGDNNQFTDIHNQVVSNLFKLYPWEFMLRETFSTKLESAGIRWLEPAWKCILSNKAILPMLWYMFPKHPNLLPAYFAEDNYPPMSNYVVKPIFSREGANITVFNDGNEIARVNGPYGKEGFIIQEFYPLPCFNNNYTIIGSWLINDIPCGIGLREDRQIITQDSSRFYPHIILD